MSDEGASLDGFSETQIIFSFLSKAAAFFVYFFGLQQKSKSLSGLRTLKMNFLSDNNNKHDMYKYTKRIYLKIPMFIFLSISITITRCVEFYLLRQIFHLLSHILHIDFFNSSYFCTIKLIITIIKTT